METSETVGTLVRDLTQIVGPDHVIWRPEDLIVYEYDGSIDRSVPAVVVVPASTEEVSESVRLANHHGIAIVPRGAGTGLSGGAVPPSGAMVIALTRLTKIIDVDPINHVAIVEPGLVNIQLSEAVAKHGLYYVPDPSSQRACTIGGNVAENAGGPHCLAYGVTTNHVLGIEVVLADGSTIWLGGAEREHLGYDLRAAFIGSEGTLGIATRIALRLIPLPESVRTIVAPFHTLDQACLTVSDVIESGIVPAALEMIDRVTIEAVEPVYQPGYPASAAAVLLVEVDGLIETVREQAQAIEAICKARGSDEIRVADDPQSRADLWASRKGAIGALGTMAPNYYLVDGVVPRTRLQEVMARVSEIGKQFRLPIANVFHAGDGNIHPCILFDERRTGDVERVVEAGARILEICVEVGGALSGEHGIGLEKQSYMGLVFNPSDLEAMAKLRPAFGAGLTFNPDKIFPGSSPDAHGVHRTSIRSTASGDVV